MKTFIYICIFRFFMLLLSFCAVLFRFFGRCGRVFRRFLRVLGCLVVFFACSRYTPFCALFSIRAPWFACIPSTHSSARAFPPLSRAARAPVAFVIGAFVGAGGVGAGWLLFWRACARAFLQKFLQ